MCKKYANFNKKYVAKVQPYFKHLGVNEIGEFGAKSGINGMRKCCIITTSAWVYFFEASFRMPKIVPRV